MTKCFSKNSHCDLDLDPITLKRKFVRGFVIPNTCVKLYRNWIINEVANTYGTDPISPSTTNLCEGIKILTAKRLQQVYRYH